MSREAFQAMPILSDFSRRKKISYFIDPMPKNARILEIGCGWGGFARYAAERTAGERFGDWVERVLWKETAVAA